MKKFSVILALLLCLCACGEGGPAPAETTTAAPTTTTEQTATEAPTTHVEIKTDKSDPYSYVVKAYSDFEQAYLHFALGYSQESMSLEDREHLFNEWKQDLDRLIQGFKMQPEN